MSAVTDLSTVVAELAAKWQTIDVGALQFWHRDEGRLALIALLLASAFLLMLRASARRRMGREGVILPALLMPKAGRRAAWVRHAPLVPFAAGVPFLVLALSDPYSALVSEDVSYPGRRISLMIDASTSMTSSFTNQTLNTVSRTGPAFFTTVAAAERFVELRRDSRYRDLIALVEFGDQAYVITPFTSDYDNILLSIALIKDPVEFSLFPNRGTVISRALEQSLSLFDAFKFLDASGNLMVIFTDGEDTTALIEGRRLEDILESAVTNDVPLYFVRTNYEKDLGDIIPDAAWKAAVERTGGRFYAVSNEATLLEAIADIDRVAAGAIETRRYTSQQPQYAMFALAAAALWTLATGMKLGLRRFQQVP